MLPPSAIPAPPGDGMPAVEVDVLIVGSLTVDVFAGGGRQPGGAVLHATRAATAGGMRVGVVTNAGDEPEARAGLAELGRLAQVHAERVPSTITFRHRLVHDVRTLELLDGGGVLAAPARAFRPAAVLYAPVAAEFGSGLAGQEYPDAVCGAALQGWLRTLEPGRPVRPLPLAALEPVLVARLAAMRLVCASMEDLAAESFAEPGALLDLVRARMGPGPLVVLTDGARGAWLDDRGQRVGVPPPRVVTGTDPTGAGDAFAVVLLHALATGHGPVRAAAIAAAGAVGYLRRRRLPG